MTAADTAATSPHTPTHHEPHDSYAQPAQDATRSTYDRMLAGFSHHVLHRPLRAYQRLVGAAILASVLNGYGTTFTVMMARQMGKNELSAHLEAGLLARYARPGDTLVKAAPTFRPQVTTSLQRLQDLLTAAQQFAPLTRRYPDGREVILKPKTQHGSQLVLGDARILFLSADPSASVVGATASLLLELDEAQDVDPDKFARDFRPMASAHNATTVLYGTAWTQDTLLEQQKHLNLALEAQDGIPRHFEFDWHHGAAVNRAYGQFVQAELDRLSPDHPLIRTQYLLLPLSDAGAFFTPQQRALLRGDHPRQYAPIPVVPPTASSSSPASDAPLHARVGGAPTLPSARGRGAGGEVYVAGVDIAGPAEDPQDPDHLLRGHHPRQDSTVVLIAEVTPAPSGATGGADTHPITRIVEAYWWTGRPLHEQCDRLVSLLKHEWRCARVVVDASGLGLDLATRLQHVLGERTVERFTFTAPSKSDLAYALLAHVAAGRLQMWDERVPGARAATSPSAAKRPRLRTKLLPPAAQGYAALSPEAAEFWREVERARPLHRAGGKLSFYVPEHYGHDDFLSALALTSRAACSTARAVPYIPPLTYIVPPRPAQWELEDRASSSRY